MQLGQIASSGFPARSITRKIHGQGGEWITAYQAEQKKHLKAVIRRIKEERLQSIRPPTNTREASSMMLKVLNKAYLLEHCYVDHPSDLAVVNISGKGLQESYHDFNEFSEVVSINASDNRLPLGAFSSFPSLQALELSLNSIMDISLVESDFIKLQFLDLSFNNLSGTGLLALGKLLALKELHLTGNNLVALPVEMSMPYSIQGTEQIKLRFPVLEKLWLDDNKLSDQATFATLAGLRKLVYLNLDNNEIYTIPMLKLLGTSHLKSETWLSNTTTADTPIPGTSRIDEESKKYAEDEDMEANYKASSAPVTSVHTPERSPTRERTSRKFVPSRSRTVGQNRYSSSKASDTGYFSSKTTSQVPGINITKHSTCTSGTSHNESKTLDIESDTDNTSEAQNINGSPDHADDAKTRLDEGKRDRERPVKVEAVDSSMLFSEHGLAPFPVLKTLSMVNNLILASEGLVACASWPLLKELIIYDNPFTRTSKGMPPLVQECLVDDKGVNVIRMRPKLDSYTDHIRKMSKDFKKISLAPPPSIPKQPLPAIEAPPTLRLPPLGSSHPSPYTTSPCQSLASDSTSSQNSSDSAGIFMTQVTGEEQPSKSTVPCEDQQTTKTETKDWSVNEAFNAQLKNLKQRYKNAPERYKGYEALLDVEDSPGDVLPTDIRGCTRALQHALRHPLTLPHRNRHDRGNAHTTTLIQRDPQLKDPCPVEGSHKVVPSPKLQRLKRVLDDIRTKGLDTETNLANILTPRTSKDRQKVSKLQKEGKKLLAEMQAHYDNVRADSLDAVISLVQKQQSSHRIAPSSLHS